MFDWQSIAVGITILTAATWLGWSFMPRRKGATTGCGSGCGSCPVAQDAKGDTPAGFVGLDLLRASAPSRTEVVTPTATMRS